MKPKGLRNWEKTRLHGMLRFVLLRGVLAYGGMLFVVMMLVIEREGTSSRAVVVAASLALLGGAAFGVLTWLFMEWVYRKFLTLTRR